MKKFLLMALLMMAGSVLFGEEETGYFTIDNRTPFKIVCVEVWENDAASEWTFCTYEDGSSWVIGGNTPTVAVDVSIPSQSKQSIYLGSKLVILLSVVWDMPRIIKIYVDMPEGEKCVTVTVKEGLEHLNRIRVNYSQSAGFSCSYRLKER